MFLKFFSQLFNVIFYLFFRLAYRNKYFQPRGARLETVDYDEILNDKRALEGTNKKGTIIIIHPNVSNLIKFEQ